MLQQFKILLFALIFHSVYSNYEDYDVDSTTSDESCIRPDETASESNCYCYSQPEIDFEYSICATNKCLLDDSRYQLIHGKCFYFEKETKNFLDARENCKKKGGKLYEPKNGSDLKNIAKIAFDVIGRTLNGNAIPWIGILDSATGAPGSAIEGTWVYDSNGLKIKFNLPLYTYGQQAYNCIEVYTSKHIQGKVFNEHCSRIRSSICELDFDRPVYPISTREADYGHQITTRPPDVQTFQRPCSALFKVITEKYIIFKLISFEFDSNVYIY